MNGGSGSPSARPALMEYVVAAIRLGTSMVPTRMGLSRLGKAVIVPGVDYFFGMPMLDQLTILSTWKRMATRLGVSRLLVKSSWAVGLE